MRKIDGIEYNEESLFSVFHITEFSEEIKSLLRARLSFICYGRSCSESGKKLYNYKNTLKEFIARYKSKSRNIQIGMIGELLSHLILNECFADFSVSTPYFNAEERSVKKDSTLFCIIQEIILCG